jgi:hypothetical protein
MYSAFGRNFKFLLSRLNKIPKIAAARLIICVASFGKFQIVLSAANAVLVVRKSKSFLCAAGPNTVLVRNCFDLTLAPPPITPPNLNANVFAESDRKEIEIAESKKLSCFGNELI